MFYDLKEDEPILLAEHLELEVKKATRKHQIQIIIVKHSVNLKAFKETMLKKMSETYRAYDVAMEKLQFELELKKLEMQERLERERKIRDKKGWEKRRDKKGWKKKKDKKGWKKRKDKKE